MTIYPQPSRTHLSSKKFCLLCCGTFMNQLFIALTGFLRCGELILDSSIAFLWLILSPYPEFFDLDNIVFHQWLSKFCTQSQCRIVPNIRCILGERFCSSRWMCTTVYMQMDLLNPSCWFLVEIDGDEGVVSWKLWLQSKWSFPGICVQIGVYGWWALLQGPYCLWFPLYVCMGDELCFKSLIAFDSHCTICLLASSLTRMCWEGECRSLHSFTDKSMVSFFSLSPRSLCALRERGI